MLQHDHDLWNVIDSVYSTCVGDGSWRTTLGSISQTFSGAGSGIFELDRSSGIIGTWILDNLEAGQDDYAARMGKINPRMHYSLPLPVGHIACDYDVMPEEEMRRHEFYSWIEKTLGTRYFMGARLLDEGRCSVFSAIEFTRKHGHVSSADLESYRLLSGHIANAWTLSKRLARVDAECDMLRHANELLPWGVVCLDQRGKISSANAAALRVFSGNDGLITDDNELRACRSSDNKALQTHIGCALASAKRESFSAGSAMTVARVPPAPELVVQIMPYVRQSLHMSDLMPAVIVFISDPTDGFAVDPEKLACVFGLSPREAELAAMLCRGFSLKGASERMAVTRNTARNHLQGIFIKTGVNSQSALMRLFMSLLLH